MIRNETTSTFNEGMVMDFNPLTSPDKIVTNALNATLITYNGNEYCLQNDMGNGRVETAYLPAGYVPVGIKEYGGIIYVASYNPITNKSQLGSFPSPERNISSNELENAGKSISNTDFKNDSLIYKLKVFSDGTVIKPGDKFSIILSNKDKNFLYADYSKFISNIDNIEGDDEKKYKIKSAKNKLLTIQLCILDSTNNYRDITPQLKRLDSYNEVIKSSSLSVIKNNQGRPYLLKDINENESVIDYRENKAVNTYNNKLSGELYLIVTVNTISSIDVSVRGYQNYNKNYENIKDDYINEDTLGILKNFDTILLFEITYHYNCPDGMMAKDEYGNKQIDEKIPSDSNYLSYNGYKEDFIVQSGNNITNDYSNSIKGIIAKFNEIEITKEFDRSKSSNNIYYSNPPKYDENTNLFSKTDILILGFNKNKDENGEYNGYKLQYPYNDDNYLFTNKIDYSFTPQTIFRYKDENKEWNGTLDGLKVSGSIDINKLGSGEININTWKYYVSNDLVTLTWGLDSYPYTGQYIKDIKMEFYDINSNLVHTITINNKKSYNGIFTDTFILNSELQPQQIYLVKIIANIFSIKNDTCINKKIVGYRWFISTPVYNQAYYKLKDYGAANDKGVFEIKDFNKVELLYNIEQKSNSTNKKQQIGNVIQKEGSENSVYNIYNYNDITTINPHIQIKNKKYYPFILNTQNIKYNFKLKDHNGTQDMSFQGSESLKGDYNVVNGITNDKQNQYNAKLNGNKLSIEVKGISEYSAPLQKTSIAVQYAFKPFIDKESFSDIFGFNIDSLKYFAKIGVGCGSWVSTGSSGHDYLYASLLYRNTYKTTSVDINDTILETDNYSKDIYSINESNYRLFDSIQKSFNQNIVILFRHPGMNPDGPDSTSSDIARDIYKYIRGGLNISKDSKLENFQLLLWNTGDSFAILPYFITNFKQNGQEEFPQIIYDFFKNVYIYKSDSEHINMYLSNLDNYVYTNDYNINISNNIIINIDIPDDNYFQIEGNDFGTKIEQLLNNLEVGNYKNNLKELVEFNLDVKEYSHNILKSFKIPTAKELYIEAQQIKTGGIKSALIGEDNIFMQDSSGNPFNIQKIYQKYTENNITKVVDVTNAKKLKGLKLGILNGKRTLLAKSTTNMTAMSNKGVGIYISDSGNHTNRTVIRIGNIPEVNIDLCEGNYDNNYFYDQYGSPIYEPGYTLKVFDTSTNEIK